jgi:L-threonylcarbamoyladenylate synthase
LDELWRRATELEGRGLRVIIIEWSAQYPNLRENKNIAHFSMPAEPADYGRELYATLRSFDQEFDRLLIEAPPDEPGWMAITDRLRRASHVPDFKNSTDKHDADLGKGLNEAIYK